MTSRTPSRKRIALILTIAASLGLVTSIAVAWGMSLLSRFEPQARAVGIGGELHGSWMLVYVCVEGRSLTVRHWTLVELPARLSDLEKRQLAEGRAGFEPAPREIHMAPDAIPPPPGALDEAAVPNIESANQFTEFAQGWPWRCVSSSRLIVATGSSSKITDEGAMLIEGTQRGLCFLPLWPGLLANTALYAAGWTLFGWGFRAARLRRRINRGRCAACAYDLSRVAGALCPECGAARPPTMRVPA